MKQLTTKDLHAVVAYFAERRSSDPLGKKALQKLMYIFQENYEIKAGYKFDFYTYGVFSKELAGDLDILRSMKVLDIIFISESASYQIKAGSDADKMINDSAVSNSEIKSCLDQFMDKTSGLPAWKLEIISTAIYVKSNENLDDDSISARIRELKPKFSWAEIEATLSEEAAIGLTRH